MAGKSRRKLSWNDILSMHWQKRKTIHDQVLAVCGDIFSRQPSLGHSPHDTYRVSFGFYSGKSTKRYDLDNFPAKWVIDAWCNNMTFDDNFRYITEVRIVYLGKKDEEQMLFQVEKNTI
jgi:hypothetical protein